MAFSERLNFFKSSPERRARRVMNEVAHSQTQEYADGIINDMLEDNVPQVDLEAKKMAAVNANLGQVEEAIAFGRTAGLSEPGVAHLGYRAAATRAADPELVIDERDQQELQILADGFRSIRDSYLPTEDQEQSGESFLSTVANHTISRVLNMGEPPVELIPQSSED